MRLYAITDGAWLAASAQAAEDKLISLASQWASGGVEVIQIRERQMSSSALERLARRVIIAVRDAQRPPQVFAKVLINGRADVAIAAGADGVHLPGEGALTPAEVRQLYAECAGTAPIVSVACHSIADVVRARDDGATMAVFAPVFGKVLRAGGGEVLRTGGDEPPIREESLPGVGLDLLHAACQAAGSMPVFALGGVTPQNAMACLEAGAVGVAGIRLFQSGRWPSLLS